MGHTIKLLTEMYGLNVGREKHLILDVTFGEWREKLDRHIDGRTHKCFNASERDTYEELSK